MINTALIIEPRYLEKLPLIIHEFYNKLGSNWKIVFYCGQNLKSLWKLHLYDDIEIRELNVNNFNTSYEYSYFCKQKSLWESLYGDYVLIFQADTWIFNEKPYTIDYFINLNKSYIGGNMTYPWFELFRENINTHYKNFNGGLSLRKKQHMINIINKFPPKMKTNNIINDLLSDEEDVYFTIGCYKLGYSVGNDKESGYFAIHTIYYDKSFGIHKPIPQIKDIIYKKYPELANLYL
jgi:hypothetical protein